MCAAEGKEISMSQASSSLAKSPSEGKKTYIWGWIVKVSIHSAFDIPVGSLQYCLCLVVIAARDGRDLLYERRSVDHCRKQVPARRC